MNLPPSVSANPLERELPDEARGNPVYEQTRQDMPLWCCGRNCGRNSRIVVLVLGIIGIACSTWVMFSPSFFQFESVRNDTFYEEDKRQPVPFEHSTQANVGMARYQVLEVYEYPWPPKKQPPGPLVGGPGNRARHLQDPAATDAPTSIPTTSPPTSAPTSTPTGAPTASPTGQPTASPSMAPSVMPSTMPPTTAASLAPTIAPSGIPTISDPNLLIDDEIGAVKSYPGDNELDATFKRGQLGAMLAPIFAAVGLFFCIIEFCFCTYRCSWLPTAFFLYMAFMFQTLTLFVFLSEDFCKYDQDCKLGAAGYASVIAVLCYFISQSLICCTPRPPPCYNCCKKKTVKKRKKKKRRDGESSRSFDPDASSSYYSDSDYGDESSRFSDEPSSYHDYPPQQQGGDYGAPPPNPDGYVDPYADPSEYDGSEYGYEDYNDASQYDGSQYGQQSQYDESQYGGQQSQYGDASNYENATTDADTFAQETYDNGTYYSQEGDNMTYGDDSTYGDGDTYGDDDGTYGSSRQFT